MIKYVPFVFILLSLSAFSQEKLTRYYNSTWSPTSKDSAVYYTEFIKQETLYSCFSYWAKTKKLNCKSVYADTLFTEPRGLLVRYYENGQVEDSSYYYENGELRETYHYYPSGKLWAHYSFDKSTGNETSEGFDYQGKKIKDFIYMKEAEFPGGKDAWIDFLSQNLKTNVPLKNKAPLGSYHVIISFVVTANGKVTDVKPETNFGYGMEDEAMRVIKKSPRWQALILLGKTQDAYRKQPITFVVTDK